MRERAQGQHPMARMRSAPLAGWVLPGLAGEPIETVTMLFQERIKAMKVDTCGLKPGAC